MPGLVKIGKTENLEGRLKALNTTALPLPFEMFYAKDIKKNVEQHIHQIFGDYRINSKREFFNVDPEKARLLLDLIPGKDVSIKSTKLNLDEEDRKEITKRKNKRSNFNFKLVGIPIGSELVFVNDSNETVKVVSEKNEVELNGEKMAISAAALKLLHKQGKKWASAQGSMFFMYDGVILQDLREKNRAE